MATSMSIVADGKYSQNIGKTIIRAECRVCLKRDGILPIFGDESKPDISMEIVLFGDVQVLENDDFPKFICESCFKLLEGAISFRTSAKRTDTLLKRRKRKMEVEIVQPSPSVKPEKTEFEVTHHIPSNAPAQFQSTKITDEYVNAEIVNSQNETSIDFVSVDMNETHNDSMTYMKHEEFLADTNVFDQIAVNNIDDDVPNTSNVNIQSLIYKCKYCNVSFQTSDNLDEHRATVEHKRNYVMSFLPKRKSKLLSSQGRKPRNPKEHICEYCNEVFTKLLYSSHMLSEHNIKIDISRSNAKKECSLCNKMFHPAALNNHMKRIHGSDNNMKPKVKLECPICKKLFSKHFYPLHLQRHKQGDTRNYVCDQCGKKFFFKSSFFTHRLIHTNALPHKCEYCPYRGRTKELLKIHVRTHTGDYPYKCTQCETRCSTKSNLNSHMRRHRGPIDFICDFCSRGFYSKIQLERHISVTHYGVKNHICSICGAAFGYRHGLMSHQRKVHKRPKGLGKPKAVYLQLEEEGLLPPEPLQEV